MFINTAKKVIPKSFFRFSQPVYHYILAFLAVLIYRFPSRGMKIVGITGTSGKTTTIEFLHNIFFEAGFKTSSSSSERFRVLDKIEPNLLKMTMPGRFRIQKFLREAKDAGSDYVFLEVTSEGIKQYRHKFIKFYAAIFTNLSPEHLESHGGFENYRAAKAKLFKLAKIHILNGDDSNFDFFSKIPAERKIVFHISDYPRDLNLKLEGEFNKYNALAALSFADFEGVPYNISKQVLEKNIVMPGRMEFVDLSDSERKKIKVLVDYAFLPQALQKVYETEQEKIKNTNGGLICVLGAAGGGRDKWRMPEMGNTAAKFCKKVFITNEDPYDDDPMEIINAVAGSHKDFTKILDRREAIREALKFAKENDVVIITGKGAEPWIMGKNGTKIPWDDRKVAREEFEKLKN